MGVRDLPLSPYLEGSVLYSGGTDSSLAAARLLDRADRVTLLTCDPGFVAGVEKARANAAILRAHFGRQRVRHRILDARKAIRAVFARPLRRDLFDYGFNMAALICLGCRLSMHTVAIIHNLLEGIPYMADGSIRKQSTSTEQLPSTLARNRAFYRERYGIISLSPIFNEDASDQALAALGVGQQKGLKRQFIIYATQYTCPMGVPADVHARIFYGRAQGDQRARDTKRYCYDKHPLMVRFIEDYFQEHGLDLAAHVARLKATAERMPEEWRQFMVGEAQHAESRPSCAK